MPVVVFTGRELSPEEDAQLHTMARSVVVKGVESPERLLDETALFLHRAIANLPSGKAAHARTPAQFGRDLAWPHRCCWSTTTPATFSRCRACWSGAACSVVTATTGREAISLLQSQNDISIVLMDIMMPEMDGYETMRAIRVGCGVPPPARSSR